MKPKVAIFDFASCEGCQLQIVNLEEQVLDLVEIVDIVSWREAMKEHSDDYDIAIIEGSIQRSMDELRLKDIRSKAKIVVALGACAHIGCVQKMANEWSIDDVKKEVYGDADIEDNPYFDTYNTKALDEVIKVDVYIPGCPIDRDEFVQVITDLVAGKKPKLPNYPVCVECKKNENICVFELGRFCIGPVTRAGCNSACPNFGHGCEGCRGYLDNPNMDSAKDVIQKYGVTVKEMMERFNMFNYRKEGY